MQNQTTEQDKTLDFHIRWTWHSIQRMYNRVALVEGLTMSMGYTLVSIDKEGTPATKLGPKMGMEARSLVRTLKKMENLGWIERRPAPSDKRVALVFVTPLGLEKRKLAVQVIEGFHNEVVNQISDEDLHCLTKTMKQINQISEIYQPKEIA